MAQDWSEDPESQTEEFSFASFLDRLGGPGVPDAGIRAAGAPGDISADDVYTFHGFLAQDAVPQPGVPEKLWRRLYLDLQRRHVMFLENDGILGNQVVEDRSAPGAQRDMLWVRPNTTIGVARVAQSIEGQFLSGQFTRAADFRDSPAGGTIAAATGVFCVGDSIGCCRPTRR